MSDTPNDDRARSRSRSPRRRSSINAPSQSAAAANTPSTAPTPAAPSASIDSESDDEDWDPDEDAEDDESAAMDASGTTDAARIFSNILRQIGGAEAGSSVNANNIQQILQGLAEQGLLHQDEDGNLVMLANDDDVQIEDLDEEDEDDDAEEGDEGDGEEAEEGDDAASAAESKAPEVQRDEAAIAEYAAYTRINRVYPTNVLRSIESLQLAHRVRPASSSQFASLSRHHIPTLVTSTEQFGGRSFCGRFSYGSGDEAGAPSMFASASQDGKIHLFETDSWKLFKEIEAREIGWSIVDIDFSTDSRFVIYSSWSNCVQLINTQGEFELHEALDFEPSSNQQHCCMFGIRFSTNESREILAGLNGGLAMLYDIERKRRIWSAQAHEDDINSVCWLDDSGNLFATGSDDASLRIWDRRLLGNPDSDSEQSGRGTVRATPVGGFLGHVHGLTCVSAMGDGNARYILSNSKDQSMKLWDIRRMLGADALAEATANRASQRRVMDYRWQRVSRAEVASSAAARRQANVDTSVMTFEGHAVAQTLIRCGFSPQHSTGYRYAITGSSDGQIYVYDILTGEIVERIGGHQSIVRDVAWHDHLIVSSSWDHSVKRHALHKEKLFDNEPAKEARAREAALAASDRPIRRGRGFARRQVDDDDEE